MAETSKTASSYRLYEDQHFAREDSSECLTWRGAAPIPRGVPVVRPIPQPWDPYTLSTHRAQNKPWHTLTPHTLWRAEESKPQTNFITCLSLAWVCPNTDSSKSEPLSPLVLHDHTFDPSTAVSGNLTSFYLPPVDPSVHPGSACPFSKLFRTRGDHHPIQHPAEIKTKLTAKKGYDPRS